MSELAEIRRALQDIRDTTTETATDMKWIKERAEGHDKQLRSLEGRVNRQDGKASVLGTIGGAVMAGFVTWFTRAHG